MNISRFIITVLIVMVIELSLVAFIRSSIPYNTTKLVKINKLYSIGVDQCENNEGLHHIRYNTIFHNKIYCNNNATIKYTGKL